MFNCSCCGQFCWPHDSGTYYGSYFDLEPPDPEIFCKRCARKLMQGAVDNPEKVIVGCWWIKPDYVRVAKSILRHQRKISLLSL